MEDFVSFSIAKKLKEKEFDYECYGHYFNGEFYADMPPKHYQREIYISAPTISQVLKWLREEKKIFVQISLFEYCYDYCILDTTMVYYDNEHKVLHQGPTGYSYDEAALAGIEYCLDNLI